MSNIYRNKKILPFFLLPAFLFMAVYLYYPFFMNIISSFQNIRVLGEAGGNWNSPWYANYAEMVHDPVVGTALKNTGIMILVTIAGQVGLALVLALMVDNIHRGTQFFRTVKGMVNQFRELLGATALVDWKDESHALVTMMLPVMWQYVGFYFVILETGLNNIDQELYESAMIDGATRWQRVKYISLPMIRNVLCTCLILAVTGALKVFDLPWTMFPKGMPLKTTFLTGTYMYYQTMEAKNVDYGSALAVLIVVLGIVLSQVAGKLFRQRED